MRDKDGTSSFPLPQAVLVGAGELERERGLSQSALFSSAMLQHYPAFCVFVAFFNASAAGRLERGTVSGDASPRGCACFVTFHLNTTAGPWIYYS